MQDGRQRRRESDSKRGLEVLVVVDAGAQGAKALRDPDPVDRAEIGRDRRHAALDLVVVNRAVALVVEHEHHRMNALADRRLQLRDRHPGATVAGERHDRPSRSRERRRDGRGDREAHRACRRAEERARPAQDQAPGRPSAEVPGVRRHDGVRREDAVQGRDDTAGMDARPIPRALVDATAILVCGAVRCHRRAPSLEARSVQHPGAEDAARFPQECPCVGSQRNRRRGDPGARCQRLRVDVRPARPWSRDRVLVGGDLVETAAEHEDRVRVLEPPPDGWRGEVAAHPEVARVVVREDVRPAPCRDDRHVHELGEANEVRRRARAQDATARQDHRPLGIEQQVENPANVRRVR